VVFPSTETERLVVKDNIVRILAQKGYLQKDIIKPEKKVIFITFSITNEVKQVEVDSDESGYNETALIYRDYYETWRVQSPQLTDPTGKTLIRRRQAPASVESVTIRGYAFNESNVLMEVWESAAASIEGTTETLPRLVSIALTNFPTREQ
jgi:hypothetical protein